MRRLPRAHQTLLHGPLVCASQHGPVKIEAQGPAVNKAVTVAEITKRMGEMSTCVAVLAYLRRRDRAVACLTTASASSRSANAIIIA